MGNLLTNETTYNVANDLGPSTFATDHFYSASSSFRLSRRTGRQLLVGGLRIKVVECEYCIKNVDTSSN